MKVTISFGCDLDDVPTNISQLLLTMGASQINDIKNTIRSAGEQCEKEHTTRALSLIDETRRKLTKLDERLMDYAVILNGFIKTTTDIKTGLFDQPPLTSSTQEVVPQDILNSEEKDDNPEIEKAND